MELSTSAIQLFVDQHENNPTNIQNLSLSDLLLQALNLPIEPEQFVDVLFNLPTSREQSTTFFSLLNKERYLSSYYNF